MMRHVAKKYTRKLRKSSNGQTDKRQCPSEDRRPGWDDTVSDLSTMKLSRDQLNRRLSERKPKLSKPNLGEFPGFPSQNDPGALNSADGMSDDPAHLAPDNVDYGAVLDSLASLAMSAPAKRSSRPMSAGSHSARSCRSEDHGPTPQSSLFRNLANHHRPPFSGAKESMHFAGRSKGTPEHASSTSSEACGDDPAASGTAQACPGTEIPSAPKRTVAAVTSVIKQPVQDGELAAKVAGLERRFAALEGLPAVVRNIQASVEQLAAGQSDLRSQVSEHQTHASALLSQLQTQLGNVLAREPTPAATAARPAGNYHVPSKTDALIADMPNPSTPAAALLRSSQSLTGPSFSGPSRHHASSAHAATLPVTASRALPSHSLPNQDTESTLSFATQGEPQCRHPAPSAPGSSMHMHAVGTGEPDAERELAAVLGAGVDGPAPHDRDQAGSPVSLKCAVSTSARTPMVPGTGKCSTPAVGTATCEGLTVVPDDKAASHHVGSEAQHSPVPGGFPGPPGQQEQETSSAELHRNTPYAEHPDGPSGPDANSLWAVAADSVAQLHHALSPSTLLDPQTADPAAEAPGSASFRQAPRNGDTSGPASLHSEPSQLEVAGHARHLAPASTETGIHAFTEVDGIMEDLEEAIETVAIDSSTPHRPPVSSYSHTHGAPCPGATSAGSPLHPFETHTASGRHAAPQPGAHFEVHSSASLASSARAGEDGATLDQSTNKYLARLKLPTVQPAIRGRSWLPGTAGVPAGLAGDYNSISAAHTRGPTGFDPVAGLLGFSTSSGGGRRGLLEGALPGSTAEHGQLAHSAPAGRSWGGGLPHTGTLHGEELPDIQGGLANQLSPAATMGWPTSQHSMRGSADVEARMPAMHSTEGSGWMRHERSSSNAAQHWGAAGAALQPYSAHTGARVALEHAGTAAGDLESTVKALGGFIEDDMPTFSEFKKVRASRKGLLPS
eukprot:jgi/Ulvmu1/8448/UM043_0026.1